MMKIWIVNVMKNEKKNSERSVSIKYQINAQIDFNAQRMNG